MNACSLVAPPTRSSTRGIASERASWSRSRYSGSSSACLSTIQQPLVSIPRAISPGVASRRGALPPGSTAGTSTATLCSPCSSGRKSASWASRSSVSRGCSLSLCFTSKGTRENPSFMVWGSNSRTVTSSPPSAQPGHPLECRARQYAFHVRCRYSADAELPPVRPQTIDHLVARLGAGIRPTELRQGVEMVQIEDRQLDPGGVLRKLHVGPDLEREGGVPGNEVA